MRRLDLDLARPQPTRGGWPLPALLGAALLLVLGLWLASQATARWLALKDEVTQLQQRSARQRGQATAPIAAQRATPASLQAAQRTAALGEETRRELDDARQILTQLALPWEPLFGAIEAALTPHTALLSIEPDATKGVVRITGEARDYPAVLVLMRRLDKPVAGQGVVLSRVHLLNHDVRDDVPERPVRFTLSARWSLSP